MLGDLSRGKFSRVNRRVESGSVVNVESWGRRADSQQR